jgi:hypothetical protein
MASPSVRARAESKLGLEYRRETPVPPGGYDAAPIDEQEAYVEDLAGVSILV